MSEQDKLVATSALVTPEVKKSLRKRSADLIYDVMMRGGGEPFGAPFEPGLSSLTEKIIRILKHTGFFAFETMERLRRRNQRNKFTRHGAAPFVGGYDRPQKRR